MGRSLKKWPFLMERRKELNRNPNPELRWQLEVLRSPLGTPMGFGPSPFSWLQSRENWEHVHEIPKLLWTSDYHELQGTCPCLAVYCDCVEDSSTGPKRDYF